MPQTSFLSNRATLVSPFSGRFWSVGVPIRNIADYSPFGVQLDGRTVSMDFYRRGFNGMEKDDEVKGGGNSYDFGARMYDSRVGRWLTIDPLISKFPSYSPYNFGLNNPILFIDLDGRDIYPALNSENQYSSVFSVLKETDSYKRLTERFLGNQNSLLLVTVYLDNKGGNTVPTRNGFDNVDVKNNVLKLMGNNEGVAIFLKTTFESSDNITYDKERIYSESYLVSVIIHELIHANIEVLFEDQKKTQELEKTFPGLKEKINNSTNKTDESHEYMALYQREIIIESLIEYDNKKNTPLREYDYYEALSWGGLTNTIAFTELMEKNPTKAINILGILEKEQFPNETKKLE